MRIGCVWDEILVTINAFGAAMEARTVTVVRVVSRGGFSESRTGIGYFNFNVDMYI